MAVDFGGVYQKKRSRAAMESKCQNRVGSAVFFYHNMKK